MWGRGHGAGTGWLCEPLDKSVAACNGRQLAALQQAESLDLINAEKLTIAEARQWGQGRRQEGSWRVGNNDHLSWARGSTSINLFLTRVRRGEESQTTSQLFAGRVDCVDWMGHWKKEAWADLVDCPKTWLRGREAGLIFSC